MDALAVGVSPWEGDFLGDSGDFLRGRLSFCCCLLRLGFCYLLILARFCLKLDAGDAGDSGESTIE